jgi:pimeloyl-ACP methyl ester carboxylesterase
MLNGETSFQREITRDIELYRQAGLPNLRDIDLVTVEGAGHNLHFEKPMQIRAQIHSFVLSNLNKIN